MRAKGIAIMALSLVTAATADGIALAKGGGHGGHGGSHGGRAVGNGAPHASGAAASHRSMGTHGAGGHAGGGCSGDSKRDCERR